ncbi:MAG TPA: hypothetical protein VFW11_20010 [Cyclobacteriaceae bacterium]|nr:hypothetical protein [Cyclobacteriaceae bacterium]
MKSVVYFLFFFIIVVWSCETYEPPAYSEPEFVNFQDSASSVREDEGTAKIRVNIGGPLNVGPITVQYSVVANDNAVALYNIKDEGTLTIPGGQGYAEIELTPVNNALPDGEKIVELTIITLNGGNYVIGFPGPDKLNSTTKIKIIDDDCPLDRSFIAGDAISGALVSETSLEIVEEGEDPQGPFFNDVTIKEHPTNTKVIIIEGFFPVYQGFDGKELQILLDACPGEASVYSSDITYTDQQGTVYEVTPEGSGIFDQETNLLTLELELNAEGGLSFGKWKFTYKK